MEKITFHITSTKKKGIKVRYRLRDGRNVQICHASNIIADAAELSKFNPDGSTKERVTVYNPELSKALSSEYNVMSKAYAMMVDNGYDKTTEVFEREISRIKNPVVITRTEKPNIVAAFREYADKSLKHGIICENRHKHLIVVASKLDRFLLINGISNLTAAEFTEEHLMDFRNFLFEEYSYVKKYPNLLYNPRR